MDVLRKRGWIADQTRLLCQAEEKSASRLFLYCPRAEAIWTWLNASGHWHFNTSFIQGSLGGVQSTLRD